MKIVISDYKDSMMPTHDVELEVLKKGLGEDVEIVIYEYTDEKKEEFYEIIKDADALLTAFIQFNREMFEHAPNIKVISINATGYDNVDLSVAKSRHIGVCPVGEYCTIDVAEYTISLILSLVKNLKIYSYDVEKNHQWRYEVGEENKRIKDLTLGIFGFGKIGKAVAKRAIALGMRVLACDPFVDKEEAVKLDVEIVDIEHLLQEAEVITNHMNLNESNYQFFDLDKFSQMTKKPYFINTGRGACVVEEDLSKALALGYIKGAGFDVLKDEHPDLAHHELVNKDNVIITPHAAFYTSSSIAELQRISTQNIVYYLTNQKNKVFKLVSD
ncbi:MULTISPECIES: NAD(P)-dependent oxidoreductase [Enterococcus]|uniref:NAD(P)-dependent oxidoreductase n=1 Tax=Enterococcus TaxID=1350 RepID=UPI001164334B|nr:NAD(P)-dependent oxidoreductase [Enterococcus avium]HAP3020765.1 C-terminal binding protein [Enterococcus faecalis]AYQ26466.1 hydroxyacid dehydrogenase [Enterococcus avium]HBI1561101.1 C-terminal binding protein [Enterococcus faecalis]HBI1564374.1 C-terminal binding protein [Enterococcus faecalis]HBI1716940.1 C-terminal binding protein [Enterococcus faecalis]